MGRSLMRVDKLQQGDLVLKELEDSKATPIAIKYKMKMSGVALKGAKPMHMNREWQVRKKSVPACDSKEVLDQIFANGGCEIDVPCKWCKTFYEEVDFGNGNTCFFICAIATQREEFDFALRIITASKGTPPDAITAYLIQTKTIGY